MAPTGDFDTKGTPTELSVNHYGWGFHAAASTDATVAGGPVKGGVPGPGYRNTGKGSEIRHRITISVQLLGFPQFLKIQDIDYVTVQLK